MGYGGQQNQDFLYMLHQCKHCGDWLNDKGFVNLTRNPKIKTKRGVYCNNCRTALMRAKMDKENKNLFKK
jgi:hypothetical protein